MNRQNVSSSNINSVGFDSGTLEVEFHSGSMYQYFNVPESVYIGLMTSYSKGSYFNEHVKNRYSFKQVR